MRDCCSKGSCQRFDRLRSQTHFALDQPCRRRLIPSLLLPTLPLSQLTEALKTFGSPSWATGDLPNPVPAREEFTTNLASMTFLMISRLVVAMVPLFAYPQAYLTFSMESP